MLLDGSSPTGGPKQRSARRDPAPDRELLCRVQSLDPAEAAAAHDELYNYCIETIKPIILANLADEDDREDVAQETCEFVIRNIPQFEYRGTPLAHWFSAIAKKMAQTRIHKNKRDALYIPRSLDTEFEEREYGRLHSASDPRTETGRPALPVHEDPDGLPADLTSIEADRIVKAVLDILPLQERRVVQLMWFGRITDDKEIGRLLNMKPGTVRVYRHRVRERISRIPELVQLFHDLFSY